MKKRNQGVIGSIVATVLVALLGPLSSASASASTAIASSAGDVQDVTTQLGTDEAPERAVSVQMTLDCGSFTGNVLNYAVEHDYCPDPHGVSTQAVQTYNCGSSWIYVYNKGYRGKMWVSYGFHSTQGIVIKRNLTIGTSLGIPWTDNPFMWADYYNTERFVGQGSLGWQSASLQGSVVLVWGGTCTIPPITDSNTI